MYNINKHVKKEENNTVERERERENKPSEERLIKFDGDG